MLNPRKRTIIGAVIMTLMIIFAAVLLITDKDISTDQLLDFSPDNTVLAVLFLWCLFAAKSLTIVFPSLVLFVLGGIMFPAPLAIAVNLAGIGITATVPYIIGRFSGEETVEYMVTKYPKVLKLREIRSKNDLFFSFFVRIINILPFDLVSMYMGAVSVPYRTYIAGTLAGCIPLVVIKTLLGNAVSDIFSPAFWCFVAADAGIAVISSTVYYLYERKHKTNDQRIYQSE